MWLWLHRLPGCGAPGAWLPSLCRGPGSRSALQVGRQVAGSSWLGPAVITKVPWTEPWVHLSTPLGSEAGRSHLLGAIWADRLRADGRNLTSPPKVKLGPLSAAPPCSLPNFRVGRALCLLSRASPRPQPLQILAGPRREGGVSPCSVPSNTFQGLPSAPRPGSRTLGLEAAPLLPLGCLLPAHLRGLLHGSPGRAPCSVVAPGCPHACVSWCLVAWARDSLPGGLIPRDWASWVGDGHSAPREPFDLESYRTSGRVEFEGDPKTLLGPGACECRRRGSWDVVV